jgi:hypothetical protein
MFQENVSFRKKVDKEATIHVIIPPKWKETSEPYSFCPRDVRVLFSKTDTVSPESAPLIFVCYFNLNKRVLFVSRLKPSEDFSTTKSNHIKGLVDAYINKVLVEFQRQARLLGSKRLIVESNLPTIIDSFLDLKFKVTTKGEGTYVGECEL